MTPAASAVGAAFWPRLLSISFSGSHPPAGDGYQQHRRTRAGSSEPLQGLACAIHLLHLLLAK